MACFHPERSLAKHAWLNICGMLVHDAGQIWVFKCFSRDISLWVGSCDRNYGQYDVSKERLWWIWKVSVLTSLCGREGTLMDAVQSGSVHSDLIVDTVALRNS